jgi:hypothetical protein
MTPGLSARARFCCRCCRLPLQPADFFSRRSFATDPPPPLHRTQVQKVTPEELEVFIANREKAILVDFFGEQPPELQDAVLCAAQPATPGRKRMHVDRLQS